MAKACKFTGVKHVIWSTMESSKNVLESKVDKINGKNFYLNKKNKYF